MRRRRSSTLFEAEQIEFNESIVKLWVMRALVELHASKEFVLYCGFSDDHLARKIGLGHWVEELEDEGYEVSGAPRKKILFDLKKLYRKVENKAEQLSCSSELKENLGKLSNIINLNAVECKILEFVVLLHTQQELSAATDCLGRLSTKQCFIVLAKLLKLDKKVVHEALGSEGMLVKSGLVSMERGPFWDNLQNKLTLLSEKVAENLLLPQQNLLDFIKDVVQESSPPTLTLGHYEHVQKELEILLPHIKQVIEDKKHGVNIFIYGPPGTGKTELVKALAKHFGITLREVSHQDEEGDFSGGHKRFRAFRAAQCFFAKQSSLLLFDEMEDVFNDGTDFFGTSSTAKHAKAWVNRMLESNPVPTFWLSNSSHIDPAFIRRFDLCMEMPVPLRKQREKIIQENCGELFTEKQIKHFSQSEYLSPAVVNKAGNVLKGIQHELPKEKWVRAFETLANNTLKTQGHPKMPRENQNELPDFYNPNYVNCSSDLHKVYEGLQQCNSARLCLFGPPGTGKTAYGRWLARELDKPLLIKRASDLISMWVGGTEKNIAHAFEQAEDEGAILLIDEVDSFLQDRRGAQRSWEVTGVNEMLTQMEAFNGIFIASTNLMDNIDQAALRRFDFKLYFDFMSSDQAQNLFRDYAASLGVSVDDENILMELAMIKNLTPGDFAAISRRHRFMPIQSAKDMLQALIEECALKEHSKRAIGFVSH